MRILLAHHMIGYPRLLSHFAEKVYAVDDANRIRLPEIPGVVSVGGRDVAALEIPKLLHSHQLDCIYAQGWANVRWVRRLMADTGLRVPILATAHSSYMLRTTVKAGLFFGVMRRYVQGFVFLAKGAERRWGGWARFLGLRNWQVPNAVDTSAFEPGPERDHSAPFRIGYVGVIHPAKGQLVAIRALAALRAQGMDVSIEFLGDILDSSYFRNLQQTILDAHLTDRVSFGGRVAHTDIAARLRSWSCYICPSLSELMPINVLEAMACGLPIIGSRIWGVEDAIEDGINGFLFPAGDHLALANRIGTMKSPGVRRRLGAAARARALSEYDLAVVGERLSRVFSAMMAPQRKK